MTLRSEIISYAEKVWHVRPDKPWAKYPDNEVLRHEDSRKWFALMFPVKKKHLGLPGEDVVDVLNLKCDPTAAASLREMDGIFPAYHMNHATWISVLLDGTVPAEEIFPLLDMSYDLTGGRKKKHAAG